MEGREYEYLSSMNIEMTQVADELNEEIDRWCENRSGWVNDRIKECINQWRMTNTNYRRMRKICGVDDVRTKHMKDMYMRKKEEAGQEVGLTLYLHNEMVMKKICEGGNKSGLYDHLKMLIRKGKENNGSKVKLVNEDEETVDDEREMEEMIEEFWGDLFCVIGKAKYGIIKELVDGGMKNEGWNISDQKLRREIKKMKENKATDEIGMIAEYLKVLGERDVHNLRMLLNEVLS